MLPRNSLMFCPAEVERIIKWNHSMMINDGIPIHYANSISTTHCVYCWFLWLLSVLSKKLFGNNDWFLTLSRIKLRSISGNQSPEHPTRNQFNDDWESIQFLPHFDYSNYYPSEEHSMPNWSDVDPQAIINSLKSHSDTVTHFSDWIFCILCHVEHKCICSTWDWVLEQVLLVNSAAKNSLLIVITRLFYCRPYRSHRTEQFLFAKYCREFSINISQR